MPPSIVMQNSVSTAPTNRVRVSSVSAAAATCAILARGRLAGMALGMLTPVATGKGLVLMGHSNMSQI
jgi:hypothetical protein